MSQCADGIFQSSLAGAVFFNPDHQTDPKQAAAGFVVLLLPYSLVGPFAGVFLDRWSRQRVLVVANLWRSVFIATAAIVLATEGAHGFVFYLTALCALSVNRFYLSALSAALPHVVTRGQLVLANSMTTTSGTAITVAGLGIGLGLRHLLGAGDNANAVIASISIAVYVGSSVVAGRMPRRMLGPEDEPAPLVDALRGTVIGLRAGARHVWERRRAAHGLLAIAASRLLFGLSTVATLLLYRNYFHDDGVLRAGLTGLGQVFAMSAIGYVTGAFVTPLVTARFGKTTWIVATFTIAGVTQIGFGLPFAKAPLLAGALVLGFTAQSANICVDTLLQEEIADDFRGRVFSFYDMGFNLTFVIAAVLAAFTLPLSGKSYAVLLAIGVGYLVIAGLYARSERGSGEVRAAEAAT
ncbi:MAG TPA: MFS transporter [Mycobacteriales bacterium]|nr:MFS transporter [Mycobacteriales bacterium]